MAYIDTARDMVTYKTLLRDSGCGSCFLGGLSDWEACLHVEPWSQAWNPRLSRVPMQAELVDTPPSICTSLGGGWVEKGPCLPCVCACAGDLGHHY